MFDGCIAFNQPLDEWDVQRVECMKEMFRGCCTFNQPLHRWNTSSLQFASHMFDGCRVFDQPLEQWDVRRVECMEAMFRNCRKFNQPLDSWDVSNVCSLSMMFECAFAFNQPLSSWTISKDACVQSMFFRASSFNQDTQFLLPVLATETSRSWEHCLVLAESLTIVPTWTDIVIDRHESVMDALRKLCYLSGLMPDGNLIPTMEVYGFQQFSLPAIIGGGTRTVISVRPRQTTTSAAAQHL